MRKAALSFRSLDKIGLGNRIGRRDHDAEAVGDSGHEMCSVSVIVVLGRADLIANPGCPMYHCVSVSGTSWSLNLRLFGAKIHR